MGEAGLSIGWGVFNVRENVSYTVSSVLWYQTMQSSGRRVAGLLSLGAIKYFLQD